MYAPAISAVEFARAQDRARSLKAQTDVSAVYNVAVKTRLDFAPRLSASIGLGHKLWLKREDLQPVHSFKLRGAFNRIAKLTPDERARGVICASAGNHAQGVALAGRELGIRAVIVMPRTTPGLKVEAVRALGGEVVLHGDAFDDAHAEARRRQEIDGLTFVHPFDDEDVIAGQGTVGKELLAQFRAETGKYPDAVFVCTGGGGLLAGVAAYTAAVAPETKVFSVEPADSDCYAQARAAGQPVRLAHVGLFADGVAVRQVGEICFAIADPLVAGALTVDTDPLCAAVRDLFYEVRAVAEPAGALGVAGARQWLSKQPTPKTAVAIVSGANIAFDRLGHVAERAEFGDASEALLAVTIPERPGSFLSFLETLGPCALTEFNYRYGGPGEAHIFVGVKLTGTGARDAREVLVEALSAAGYATVDLTHSDMAQDHVRYMVGGRAQPADERLFRFEFPERPGACLQFLQAVGARRNISLFHYRNHGAAYGRVLVGLQVPATDRDACAADLAALGYEYIEETDNPAYRFFLA